MTLRDKSRHKEDYWENKSLLCFNTAIKYIDNDPLLCLELLNGFLILRPNFFEAYPYLVLIYERFGQWEKRDKIYHEIFKWALGDWNAALDAKDNNDFELAELHFNLCTEKLDFFIEKIPGFYYAYKMRARCFYQLGLIEKSNNDWKLFEEHEKIGPMEVFSWTKNFNLF